VDRRAPEGGGALTPLTNYVDVPWADGVAWNYAAIRPTTYRLGQSPSNATLENFTMLDDDGKPISAATIENDNFLWFENFGSSCGGSGVSSAEELNQTQARARISTTAAHRQRLTER